MKKSLENGATSKTNNAPALGDRGRYKKKITCLGIYLVILLLGLFGNSSIAYGKNSNSYYIHKVLEYYNLYNLYETIEQTTISRTDFESYINNRNGIYIDVSNDTTTGGINRITIYGIDYIDNQNRGQYTKYIRYYINGKNGLIQNSGTLQASGAVSITNAIPNTSYRYAFMIGPYLSTTGYDKAYQARTEYF